MLTYIKVLHDFDTEIANILSFVDFPKVHSEETW